MVCAKSTICIRIICVAALELLCCLKSACSFDLPTRKSNDNLFELRDMNFRRVHEQIARSDGDLTLGALLPIHLSDKRLCSGLYVDGIMLTEAIVFALREVKNKKLLPEEIILGYEIRDTCNSVLLSQRHTLDIVCQVTTYVNESRSSLHSSQKHKNRGVIAVVGAGNSEISVAVNRVLSAFDIPQIGFASTSRYLSEKLRFPSFLRTVPSDTYQVKGLVALLRKFSWNYIGLLSSDGDYGRPLAETFKSLAKDGGICIAYEHLVPFQVIQHKAKSIAKELDLETSLDVIVILLPEPDVETILLAMLEVGLKNKTLIASDSWSKAIKDPKFSEVVAGTLGFAHYYTPIKEFEDYFLALKPNTNSWNPWFNETWEHLFDCLLSVDSDHPNETASRALCNFKEQHLKKEQFTRFHYISNIINAVFSVANGINALCKKQLSTPCDVSLFTTQKLLKTLEGMAFQKYDGEEIMFDENGDVKGKYNLVNILPDLTTQNVGVWNGEDLEFDDKKRIWWSNGNGVSPPRGVCSKPCSPGSYQLASKENPRCCWTCQRCHTGTFSNKTGAIKCYPCPKNYITNLNQTDCVFIPLQYLDWNSFWTISIVIMALLSVSFLIFVAMLFLRHLNTPIVKSSNRELSFLLGLGLFMTFLVPFVFAGKPSKLKCIISQVMFCVGCALALSAMLFRTLRIVLLFEFMNRRRWLLNNKYQIAMTIALTFVELTYCLFWLAVNPPGVKTTIIRPTKRYLVCNFDKYWYGGSYVLLIVLSFLCTALAVKGRRLPKNFNEVQYIALSMFTFNIVWVVFMGAQYGASLEYDVKINCFAMIISSSMILLLLFGPKVFILLFRAHLNKKEEFQAEVRRYSFGVPNMSTISVPASAPSSRRGSFANFRAPNHSNDKFLSVQLGNLKCRRSHSFDAIASGLYQSAPRAPNHCSKETQTNFPGDVLNASELRRNSPVIVKVIEEDTTDSSQNKGRSIQEVNKRPDLRTSDLNDDLNGENETEFQVEKGSSLEKLETLTDFNADSSNETIEHKSERSDELDNLLDDLGVLDNNITSKRTKSFASSIEPRLSNRNQALSTGIGNDIRGSCNVPRGNHNELCKSYDSTGSLCHEDAHPNQNLINVGWACKSENLNSSDHRNKIERETIL